jgi:ADP-ribose pyrophosphatase YjhB (NUDIX family)
MPRVRVGVVIVRDGCLLLMRHRRLARTYWVVPGGKVEEFEALDAAAVREIREETGLEITLGSLVAVFETSDRQDRRVVNIVFVSDATAGDLALPAGGPLVESLDRAELTDPTTLATIDVRPSALRPVLLELLDGGRPAPRYLGDLTDEILEDAP